MIGRAALKRSLSADAADMNDDDADWISVEDAVTHVATTQQCYREKALCLVKKAADNLKLKSRTTANSAPRWNMSEMAGAEVYHSGGGTRIEVCREDVLKLWPEHRKDATRPAPPETGSNATRRHPRPISNGICLAIDNLWPAPGFTDTELGVLMEPEVCHGATEVYEGVQA
jgi:hypothetical protein